MIKSPKPNPGITFNIFVSNLTRPPSAFDKPSYSVLPTIYPTNPPVLLFTFLTTALFTSRLESST